MKIKKKTWPKFFKEILVGKKTFDVRIADFKVKPGDILVFEEWDPKRKRYTGKKIEKKITYVLKTKGQLFWKKKAIVKHGFQIMSFK
jgi:hypothetical protein